MKICEWIGGIVVICFILGLIVAAITTIGWVNVLYCSVFTFLLWCVLLFLTGIITKE